MYTSKTNSVVSLIVPTSMKYLIDVDETVYPFSSSFDIGNYDLEAARRLVTEMCDWLNTTIGYSPKWRIASNSDSWWDITISDEICIIFLFKTEGDAIAFKLRWL